jgi:N,N'-diacetyllegionaminate synthase
MKCPLFIAEIGMNADGNFDLNYELIRQASISGADIAKFQLGWRSGKEDINFIDEERLGLLIEWCEFHQIEFMASIITPEAYELIKKFDVKRYKIASRTLIDNIELARNIVSEGKETFISLGMWEFDKIPFSEKNIKYLYCKSIYPTRIGDIPDFPESFGDKFYGYSDHFMGIEACILAISRGAKIIEKHFTLNKNSKVIRDHSLSATPEEFKQLVSIGKSLFKIQDRLRNKD